MNDISNNIGIVQSTIIYLSEAYQLKKVSLRVREIWRTYEPWFRYFSTNMELNNLIR